MVVIVLTFVVKGQVTSTEAVDNLKRSSRRRIGHSVEIFTFAENIEISSVMAPAGTSSL